ncbi:unnamed protein product, partial [Allacma fusca]
SIVEDLRLKAVNSWRGGYIFLSVDALFKASYY